MNLKEWPTLPELIRIELAKAQMNSGMTLIIEEAPETANYPAAFNTAMVKVFNPTHEITSTVTGTLLMIVSARDLGTVNGYITGANCFGEANHDLSPREVASLLIRAYMRDLEDYNREQPQKQINTPDQALAAGYLQRR